MNAEALQKTIETGDVHYYSRSRQALWKKGETSGEVQKLIRLATDCDQDVVLLTVEQMGRGAACPHRRKSCFYRVLENGVLLTDTASRGCSIPTGVLPRMTHLALRPWVPTETYIQVAWPTSPARQSSAQIAGGGSSC